jgi:chromosome segregation ATPase
VALKKPSELFNQKSSLDTVQEQLMNAEPQKIENLTEAFQVFKTNLNHIQSLSDFSSTLDGFKENVERIDLLSKEIETIKESISDTLKKEDLDTAMMSHLLFVEESIENIQGKIKGLNSKTLYNIKEEFGELEETVSDFIRLDVPSYKKQILDSERRIDTRFFDFKNQIKEEVISIDSHLTEKLSTISETISSINESHLNEFRNEVSVLENKVDDALENELPRYKRFFTETKLKTEEKIKNVTDFVESKVDTLENDYQNQIQNLNSLVKDFTEQEIPKYRSLITESKLQVEKDFITLEESIQNKIQQIDESIKSLIEDTHHQNQENDLKVTNQLLDLQKIVESSKNQINTISNTYENLYKDFRNREIHENQKLESYEVLLNDFSEKINVLENNLNDNVSLLHEDLNISTSKYYDVLKKEVGYFEENISNKVKDLEVNIVVNEKHIKDIQNSVYDVLDNLKLDLIEEKSQELTEKISYVESILEKFNEKTILNEGLLNEPPTVKNSDPLTPLDQNYVTLDQLQNHYRTFINRIQQQLSTLGGGGAVRLDDLDDVDHSNITTNNLLIYNGNKWVGIASTALSGSGTLIGLTDVDSSNLGDGRFLRYDASTSEFTFAPVSATNLELIAGDIQSGILTTNSTSPAVVMSISASTYRSVHYQVQVTEGSNYNMTTINVIHDGTTTYMSEYGTINQPIGIATFSSDISGGALRLLGHPAFTSSTTFKTIFTAIESS